MNYNIYTNSIINIVILPKHNEKTMSSLFQGFNSDIFQQDYHYILSKSLTFPMNAAEVFMTHNELIDYRCTSAVATRLLLNVDSFLKSKDYFKDSHFVFITCVGNEFDLIRTIDFKYKYSPIIISLNDSADVNLSECDIFKFDDIIIERFEKIKANDDLDDVTLELLNSKEVRERSSILLDIPTLNHSITRPNEVALLSLGFNLKDVGKFVGDGNKKKFIDAMIESSNNFDTIIKQQKFDSKSDLIIYCPSIFNFLYNFDCDFWVKFKRKVKNKQAKFFLFNSFLKNPNYSGNTFSDKRNMNKIFTNKIVTRTMMLRKFELAYTVTAIESLAVTNVCQAIRLPNSVNFHNLKLNELEILSRSNLPNFINDFNKVFKSFTEELTNEIGSDLISIIDKKESIVICSDIPLEWVAIKNIPLMFTHEISKIPTTPGNLLLQTATNFSNVSLNSAKLLKITVIRSFDNKDPLKNILVSTLNEFIKVYNEIELIVVDVNNKDELISELSKVNTPILIFDCHGSHGGVDSNGWLLIGSEAVNIWELPCKGMIPPIVILSACLTSAIGGSHASVANGLLGLGALSIIGTFLPVDAIKSSLFIGRIFLRLSGYLTALKKINVSCLTWRKFISDFFKMSFVTDVLISLRDDYKLMTMSEYTEIHYEINAAINSFRRDWYEMLITKVAEVSKYDNDSIQAAIDEIGFVETMNYLQIGRPENIIITL